MNICIHGTSGEKQCDKCEMHHDINLIKSQIRVLDKVIANQLMLDERLSELEEWTRKEEDRFHDRLDACEQNYPSLWKRLKTIEDFIGQNYKTDIEKIKAEINSHWKLLSDLSPKLDKKPYQCPICNGKGIFQVTISMAGYYDQVCSSCEGKGIVWD